MKRSCGADISSPGQERIAAVLTYHKHLVEFQSFCQIKGGYGQTGMKGAAVPVNIRNRLSFVLQ